jgi:hypothetical protein
MKYIDIIKNEMNLHISSHLPHYDRTLISRRVGDFFFFFSDSIRFTKSFMIRANIKNHFHPTIYLVEKHKNATQENIITSSPYLNFMHFALREILRDKSYKHEIEYKIVLNNDCPRYYTKNDLVLSFDYINPESEFDIFIDKSVSKYNNRCPEAHNINPKLFAIFDQYIKDYEIVLKQLVCSKKSQNIFAPYNDKPELINLVCEIFSLSDYNKDSFFSEESLILVYEECLNIAILAANTICYV